MPSSLQTIYTPLLHQSLATLLNLCLLTKQAHHPELSAHFPFHHPPSRYSRAVDWSPSCAFHCYSEELHRSPVSVFRNATIPLDPYWEQLFVEDPHFHSKLGIVTMAFLPNELFIMIVEFLVDRKINHLDPVVAKDLQSLRLVSLLFLHGSVTSAPACHQVSLRQD